MAKASQVLILENEFYIIKAPNGKVLEVKNDEVGIGFKGGMDPASEFFFAGDFVFKGDGGLCDVGGIDRKQHRCVIGGRGADGDGSGCHRKPF